MDEKQKETQLEPDQEIQQEPQEKSQAELYYEEHKHDFDGLFQWKKDKKDGDEEQEEECKDDPTKSQAENYYNKNIDQLENVYQIKKKKSKKEEQKPATSNIDLQQYDEKDLPPVRMGDKEDTSLPHIPVSYNLTEEEVETGMKAFQKKHLFKRNLIFTILFGLVLVFYLIDLFLRTPSTVTYLGTIVCIAVVFIIWYNPVRHRKQVAKAMAQIEEPFTMDIYDEYIFVKEENGGFRIMYNNPSNFILNQKDKYIISVGKERIYILPKRCLDEEQQAGINQKFQALGERLIQTEA